jgi:DNA invertase Pin-like site-specific DNA recombinase
MAGEKCLVYCRVSSKKQAEDDKTSLDTQEAECRKACEERGYEVVGVYRETFPRSDRNRPLLNHLRQRLRAGEATVAMAMVIDRLSGDQQDVYVLVDEAQQYKARWEFAREEFEETAFGRLYMSVKSFRAEAEIETMSVRVKDGNRAKKEKGELLGVIPLGYRKVNPTTVKRHKLHAPTIERIFHLYANEGLSLRKLGETLKAEGRTTGRNKTEWSTSALNRIIENPKYMGRWPANQWDTIREKGRKPRYVLKPEDEWIWHDNLALVEPDLWRKANRIRENARQASSRRAKTPGNFLLQADHLRCGLCKGKLYGITPPEEARERAPYYVCNRRSVYDACKGVYISTKVLDPAIWSIVHELLEDPDRLMDWVLAQAKDGTLDEAIAKARAEEKAVQATIEDRSERFALAPKSVLPKLAEQIEGLERRLEVVQRELAGMEQQLAEREQLAQAGGALDSWLTDAQARLEELTHKEKQGILYDLGVKITVYPDNQTPRWTLHMSPDVLLFGPMAMEPGFYDLFDDGKPGIFDLDEVSVAKSCALLSATPRA